ncbi:ABC transporter ATP-binding protein [Streptomyces pilosus]|uniref:Nickel import system ATP-binding protein NikD n=1 Tax=Streptomyces pilosus TaxID=28893 RepID=A0A918BP73_9ACTN|nr:ABC transporter ATP-binding protein [Streptomyces pilosus]
MTERPSTPTSGTTTEPPPEPPATATTPAAGTERVPAPGAAESGAVTGPGPVPVSETGEAGAVTGHLPAPAAAAGPAGRAPVLSVRELSVRFLLPGGRRIAAVTDAHFDVAPGECLALIGESGCGKSVLASALLGLLPANAQTAGSAHLGDLDLLTAGERTLARTVRGRRIGLIPQSPAAHLTPVRTIRSQMEETVAQLTGERNRSTLRTAAEQAAGRAGFPLDHLDRHPHELSGGLAQRAATALALIGDAPLLLADEPTTGLDRDLVDRTVDELRRHVDADRALLIITHDLAAAERVADRVAVMYAGRIVEITGADAFFGAPGPRHPYSRGLLEALPDRSFTPIPGLPPELGSLPDGCAFAPRCDRATGICATLPPLTDSVACHHPAPARTPEDLRA